jgi:hypothetical protein
MGIGKVTGSYRFGGGVCWPDCTGLCAIALTLFDQTFLQMLERFQISGGCDVLPSNWSTGMLLAKKSLYL